MKCPCCKGEGGEIDVDWRSYSYPCGFCHDTLRVSFLKWLWWKRHDTERRIPWRKSKIQPL